MEESKTFSSDESQSSDSDEVLQVENPKDLPFWIAQPFKFNLLIFVLVVCVGIVSFKCHRDIDWITAWYLVVQIITTIGYGDIPGGSSFRWWMIFYLLVLTVLMANVMNDLFSTLVAASEANIQRNIQAIQRHLSNKQRANDASLERRYGQFNQIAAPVLTFWFFVMTWALFFHYYEYCSCGYAGSEDFVVGCVEGARCAKTGGFRKEFSDSFYMAVVTFSTVGFGDFTPQTPLGRALGSIWMILGVLAFGNMVSKIALAIDHHKKSVKEHVQRRRGREIWSEMDKDEEGIVHKDAFLIFMLRRKNLVTQATLDEFGQIFNSLDSDANGELTVDEVCSSLNKLGL